LRRNCGNVGMITCLRFFFSFWIFFYTACWTWFECSGWLSNGMYWAIIALISSSIYLCSAHNYCIL